jgi:hypothetical protein
LEQYGKGLVQCEAALGEEIREPIERLKWSLWHGQVANTNFMDGTLVIVTFDESDNLFPLQQANWIYTLFLGPMIRPGSSNEEIDHYDERRTIEEQLGIEPISSLGKPITSIWK